MKRYLTTSSALQLLQLNNHCTSHSYNNHNYDDLLPPLTYKQLRNAYFKAAKRCHPDLAPSVKVTTSLSQSSSRQSSNMFLQITEAYELLIPYTINTIIDPIFGDESTLSEKEKYEIEEYKEACQLWLGISAEIVEESKKCPLFRQWLMGNTDSALKWNTFLCLNGGLAPRLYKSQKEHQQLLLMAGSSEDLYDKNADIDENENGNGVNNNSTTNVRTRRRRKR